MTAKHSGRSRYLLIGSALLVLGSVPSVAVASLTVHHGRFYVDFDDGTSAICRVFENSITASYAGPLHDYKGEGDCILFAGGPARPDLPPIDQARVYTYVAGQRLNTFHRFQFTGRFDARTRRTTELLKFPVLQSDKYRTATTVQLEMDCPFDPWLTWKQLGFDAEGAIRPGVDVCALRQITTQGNLLTARGMSDLMRRGFESASPPWPYTTILLGVDTLKRLRDTLAQAEQAERAARIANATAGSVRDASTTRQGTVTTPLSGAASTTRAGAAVGGANTGTGTVAAALRLNAAQAAAQPTGGAASAPAPAPQSGQSMPVGGAASAPAPGVASTAPQSGLAMNQLQTSVASRQRSLATGAAATGAVNAQAAAVASNLGSPAPENAAAARPAPTRLRITAPIADSQVRQGELRVQAALAGASATRDAELEFVRLSADGAAAPVQWVVPMEQLAQGVTVPEASAPRRSGRWQLRVRPAGASGGAWSEPIAFDYIAASEPRGWAGGRKSDALERQGLNPQPLPPKEAKKANPFERQGLNPQPLPPRDVATPASTFQR